MSIKPILIVAGEPNSIFIEILIKSLVKKKFKSPIVLIVSTKTFLLQMQKLKINFPFKIIEKNNVNNLILDNRKLNLININYNTNKAFEKISNKSNKYMEKCFNLVLDIHRKYLIYMG